MPSHAAHVPLDRSLRETNAQLQELAANALRSPKPIVRGHCVDQGDGIAGNLWSCDLVLRLPSPEKPESFAVPAKQGLWFDQKKGIAPSWHEASEQHEKRPIPGCERGPLDHSCRDDDPLAQQGVLLHREAMAFRQG